MKSTYKLLNIYLDGRPLPTQIPEIVGTAEVSKYYEIEDEMNIFDFPICRRKVSGMKLLSYQSELDILNLVDRLPDCKELLIILDYNSIAEAAQNLFLKRILQVVSLLKTHYPDMNIKFVGDSTDILPAWIFCGKIPDNASHY